MIERNHISGFTLFFILEVFWKTAKQIIPMESHHAQDEAVSSTETLHKATAKQIIPMESSSIESSSIESSSIESSSMESHHAQDEAASSAEILHNATVFMEQVKVIDFIWEQVKRLIDR